MGALHGKKPKAFGLRLSLTNIWDYLFISYVQGLLFSSPDIK